MSTTLNSPYPDIKYPRRSPSTESEVQTTRPPSNFFTLRSVPLQWNSSPGQDMDYRTLEVQSLLCKSYLLLPNPANDCLQYALPLKSCRLGSVTEKWWKFRSVYPIITQPKYELESTNLAPTRDVSDMISTAEEFIRPMVTHVRISQLLQLVASKIRLTLMFLILICVLLVLGPAGFVLDPALVVVVIPGLALVAVAFVLLILKRTVETREAYKHLEANLEAFCDRQKILRTKGYTVRCVGIFVLQITKVTSGA